MQMFKYTYMAGKITLNIDGRNLVLNRDTQILTGRQEEVVLAAMKKIKQIRRIVANDLEVAEYVAKHPIKTSAKTFSDFEIAQEVFRRWPELRSCCPVLDSAFDKTVRQNEPDLFGPEVGGGFDDEAVLDEKQTDLEAVLEPVLVGVTESSTEKSEEKSEEPKAAVVEPIIVEQIGDLIPLSDKAEEITTDGIPEIKEAPIAEIPVLGEEKPTVTTGKGKGRNTVKTQI